MNENSIDMMATQEYTDESSLGNYHELLCEIQLARKILMSSKKESVTVKMTTVI